MPYRGDLNAILSLFTGAEGDERVAKLTIDVCKYGLTPAALWSMPVHQLLFMYFIPPNLAESEPSILEKVINLNTGKAVPFVPKWLFAKKEDRHGDDEGSC